MDDGLFAEFGSGEALRAAIAHVHAQGLQRLDAFMPVPDPEVEQALSRRPRAIPWMTAAAAVLGIAIGYGLQWWLVAWIYPLDVGGRPPHAPLAFVPITFETAVLLAASTAFVAVLAMSGLPRLWRPAFEIEGFERASIDRYWLFVAAEQPGFDESALTAELREIGALRVVRPPEVHA